MESKCDECKTRECEKLYKIIELDKYKYPDIYKFETYKNICFVCGKDMLVKMIGDKYEL